MSLSLARYSAYSALMTTQTQISVASANIANADTEGYTKKTATQVATVSNGIGTGTTITGISSNVDKLLLKSLFQAVSALGSATVTDSYASQLQSLFGSTSSGDDSSGTSIANTIAALETAIADLADTPESETLKAQVVSALDDVAAQLRDTSNQIQTLRSNADQEIASDVDQANDLLATIKDLNDQIVKEQAAGNSTADLEDQRNTALQDLSSLMDINYYSTDSGAIYVYTTSGQVLLNSAVHELSFTSAGSVTSSAAYPGGLSGITVDGTDITAQIKSGSIAALIDQRDNVLTDAQSELDQLAVALADSLNAISNASTASPPPNSLTGATEVASGDSLSASGIFRVAETDSDGNLVSYQDFDLSGYATVGDLVSAIDGMDGVSANIDADGHVVITADDSNNGVAVNEMTSSVGSSGRGLADYLGLNDLVAATGAGDFTVRSDILSNTSLLPNSTLDPSSTLTVGDSVVPEGSTAMAQSLYDAMTGDTSFSAAGNLSNRSTSFASYAADIVADAASAATKAVNTLTIKETVKSNLADTVSSQSGVNIDEETARVSQLENEYAAAAQLLQVLNSMFSSLLESVQSS